VNSRGFLYEQSKFRLNKISLLDEKRYTKFLTVKHYLKKVFIKPKRSVGNDNHLLAFDEWTNEYYHWFCEFLPRVFSVRDVLKDYVLLLPDTDFVKNIGLESLDFFELKPLKIEYLQPKELVKIKNLSIVTHTCFTGYINDKIISDMKKFINKKVDYSSSLNKKIYITRDKAKYRKVLNEEEIQDLVKSRGYEIVRYEDLSWKDQIIKAASAKSIIAMHGAGLVNMFFMQADSSVLEFRRDKIYHNQCFWHLAGALKYNYYYLFGTPDDENLVLEGDGCNLTVDTEKLLSIIDKMETQH
ncbi:MAG: glycosyltransferase family 61 protein, partial [Pedobacter sp.]